MSREIDFTDAENKGRYTREKGEFVDGKSVADCVSTKKRDTEAVQFKKLHESRAKNVDPFGHMSNELVINVAS